MADREHMVMDLLCGELQTSWSYCDSSCIHCKFCHEESDMGARVPICVHGFGSSKESCDCYMTQREYSEFVRSGFANLKAENAKLREQVTQLQFDWESERDYADQMEAKEKRAVAENDKLRELVVMMRPICMDGKRCTFADRIYISSTMKELGIEVDDA